MVILPRKALSVMVPFCFCFIADMAAIFQVVKLASHGCQIQDMTGGVPWWLERWPPTRNGSSLSS